MGSAVQGTPGRSREDQERARRSKEEQEEQGEARRNREEQGGAGRSRETQRGAERDNEKPNRQKEPEIIALGNHAPLEGKRYRKRKGENAGSEVYDLAYECQDTARHDRPSCRKR